MAVPVPSVAVAVAVSVGEQDQAKQVDSETDGADDQHKAWVLDLGEGREKSCGGAVCVIE